MVNGGSCRSEETQKFDIEKEYFAPHSLSIFNIQNCLTFSRTYFCFRGTFIGQKRLRAKTNVCRIWEKDYHFYLCEKAFMHYSVADPDPGSGAFLTPGSGIRNRFFPDLGFRIPNSYFREFSDNILGKKFYNSLRIAPNFILQHLKTKIMYNFVKFVATYRERCGYLYIIIHTENSYMYLS